MMSCIFAFYMALTSASVALPVRTMASQAPAGRSASASDDDPDALYAKRNDLEPARRAERIWAARVAADRRAYEAAWKLARARYWLGRHVPPEARKASLEAGIDAARVAIAAEPRRPEGHFWLAANMGALAESYGLRQGLKYRGDIKNALLTVLAIDPAFQGGSADRALGRWYFKVPGLFGGSKTKSEEHLRRSLAYAPGSSASHYFLGETLLDQNRRAEARAEFQRVIDAPVNPEWESEDREFKVSATRMLGVIK